MGIVIEFGNETRRRMGLDALFEVARDLVNGTEAGLVSKKGSDPFIEVYS